MPNVGTMNNLCRMIVWFAVADAENAHTVHARFY